jgi:hypothetical protein
MPRGIRKKVKVPETEVSFKQLTQIESLQFGVLDGEIRNHAQGIRICELEINEARRQFTDKVVQLEGNIKQLRAMLADKKPLYDKLLSGFAKKYNISDIKNMSIDPDTGIVRDLTQDV